MTARLAVKSDIAAGEEPGVFFEQVRVRNENDVAEGLSLARGNCRSRFGPVMSPLATGFS